jgi:hypothetical protein
LCHLLVESACEKSTFADLEKFQLELTHMTIHFGSGPGKSTHTHSHTHSNLESRNKVICDAMERVLITMAQLSTHR